VQLGESGDVGCVALSAKRKPVSCVPGMAALIELQAFPATLVFVQNNATN
jgi:hypothetical protein